MSLVSCWGQAVKNQSECSHTNADNPSWKYAVAPGRISHLCLSHKITDYSWVKVSELGRMFVILLPSGISSFSLVWSNRSDFSHARKAGRPKPKTEKENIGKGVKGVIDAIGLKVHGHEVWVLKHTHTHVSFPKHQERPWKTKASELEWCFQECQHSHLNHGSDVMQIKKRPSN